MRIKILAGAAMVALLGFAQAPAAQATVMGVGAGDLVKLQNDRNPATHEDEAVYYLDADWKRHPFPNERVYFSWYRDFSGVKELAASEMAEFRMGSPVVYRPGTRLVKIQSVPKVYAVEPGGVLRWIVSESVAKSLYGNDWSKRVDDVAETFFMNYREGAPLTLAAWPTGSFVRRSSDASVFWINGLTKRRVQADALTALRVAESDIVAATGDLGDYGDEIDLLDAPWNMIDAAQISVVEPAPAPLVDFPEASVPQRDGEKVLCSLRLSANTPTMIKQVRVRLSGALWDGGTPRLTDLHFIDAEGGDAFGINQLEHPGSVEETLTWPGAYSVPAGEARTLDLVARPSAGVAAGSSVTVRAERAALTLADGGNGNAIPNYLPRGEFPEITAVIR